MPELGDQRLPGRFWSKVTVDDVTGCWLWTAAKTDRGYPNFGSWPTIGKCTGAHRVAYEVLVGPIPEGWTIDHVRSRGCVNRHCVNPAHLEAVTYWENNIRAETISTLNARKTHCPEGHPYEGDNLVVRRDPSGKTQRRCRTCVNAKAREYKQRLRARSEAGV